MLCDDLAQARVELLAVLVEHHGVGVPVQLLEAQATVVLPLDLLDGVLQQVPDVVDVLLVHRHLKGGRGKGEREKGGNRERDRQGERKKNEEGLVYLDFAFSSVHSLNTPALPGSS